MSPVDHRIDVELLTQVLDALPHPVFVKDRQHRWMLMNRAMCELIGQSAEALLGRSDFDLFPAEQARVFWATDDRVFTTGEVDENEEMITDHAGQVRTIRTRKLRLTQPDGTHVLVGVIFDVTQHREAEAQVQYLAHHDPLTKLPNRALLRARLERDLARVRRTGEALAVLYLDLDRFKEVNDLYGHSTGDALLQEAARRLIENLRTYDTAARLGGDEFALVLPGIDDAEAAVRIGERLVARLSEPYGIGDGDATVGASVGIAVYPSDATDAENLLRCADLALYSAKNDGRGCARLFSRDLEDKLRARRAIEAELKAALLLEEQLGLHYQPQFDIDTQQLVGFEALVRWQHPRLGSIPPLEFVPLAEETNLIMPLGAWVLRRACEDALAWPEPLAVSINVSPVQFRQRDLPDLVAEVLATTGLPPSRLELEITETVLLQDSETTLRTLARLKAMGVRIAMDDFGTGYSSLGHLRRFPFDKIKIDRSFTEELDRRADARAIVDATLSLGRNLSVVTTAEGVENAAQLERLRQMGCGQIQGFYCGRPIPAAAVREALAEGGPGRSLMAWIDGQAIADAPDGHDCCRLEAHPDDGRVPDTAAACMKPIRRGVTTGRPPLTAPAG